MKQLSGFWLSILAVAMLVSSCDVVGGVLKFTFWMGALFVIVVIILLVWLFRKFRR
jgi:hypothetical protein